MATVWSPPPLKVVRKWKRPADFSFWMLRAPIVRERVVHLLSAFCGDDLEFLPFYITERGEELFAMNVLTTDATRPVFKQDRKSIVYARRQFGELARDKKFTGLALADPDADNIRLTIRGRDVNAFPGLGT